MGTALRADGADIGQLAEGCYQLSSAALQVGCGAAHRQDGFTQLGDGSTRPAGTDGQLIAEFIQIRLRCLNAQGCHCLCSKVRCVG